MAEPYTPEPSIVDTLTVPDDFTPVPLPAEPDVPANYTDQDGALALLDRRKREKDAALDAFWQQQLNTPPPAAATSKWNRDAIRQNIITTAQQYNVNPLLALAVADTESSYNPRAVSPKGAKGVMQLMDPTAQRFGVKDAWDVEQNIAGGVKYLQTLGQLFPGRTDLQLAAYNAGEGAVQKYGNAIPPFPETQNYVKKALGTMQTLSTTVLPVPEHPQAAELGPELARLKTGAGTPAAIPPHPQAKELAPEAARLRPQPMAPVGLPFVDVGIHEAPVANLVLGGARSVLGGFLEAVGNTGTIPTSIGEIVSPAVPDTARNMISQLQIAAPGMPLQNLVSIWNSLGESASEAARNIDVPEARRTFVNDFARTAGAMGFYWGTAFLTGNSTLVATTLESFNEANDVYKNLKPIVGVQEAGRRAGITAAANMLVLGITNRWGIGGRANTMLGKVVGGIIGEDIQETVQYELSRRQFWVPNTHPQAQALKAHGWQEAGGRVYQPFNFRTLAEILAISSILGGGTAYVEGLAFGLHGTPQQIQERTERVQAQDAQAVSQQIPESVVRLNYQAPTMPELAVPGSAVRTPQGDLLQVYHGTDAVFNIFGRTAARDPGSRGAGFYFAENPAIASEKYAIWSFRDDPTMQQQQARDYVRAWENVIQQIQAEPDTIEDKASRLAMAQKNLERERQRVIDTAEERPLAPNVHPVYLDIRKPFAFPAAVTSEVRAAFLAATQGQPTAQAAIENLSDTATLEDLWKALTERPPAGPDTDMFGQLFERPSAPMTRDEMPALLQRAGYDGIFYIGHQDGRVWVAFRPEQIIPAFDINALLEMAKQETFEAPVQEATPTQAPAGDVQTFASIGTTLQRWRSLMQRDSRTWPGQLGQGLRQGERGSVPLPEGGGVSPQQALQDLDDSLAIARAFGDSPERIAQLEAQRAALLAHTQAGATAQTPPPLPEEAFNLPPATPEPEGPALMEQAPGAQMQGAQNLRDASGRWRIPLRDIPPAELELQDFIRQQGGLQLATETDVPGELQALITRAETGIYGLQNNASGLTLQQMAERAAEHGFIFTADKTELLAAMDASITQNISTYSRYGTGHVPGIAAPVEAIAPEQQPGRPAPPPLSGTQGAPQVVIMSEAQARMQQRAQSLSSFLVDDRVEFRLPNGEQRQGRVAGVNGPEVVVEYGRRRERVTFDVLAPGVRDVRLKLTRAQQQAEAAGLVDLPRVLTEQIDAVLQNPERAISGRITGINFDRIQTPEHVKQYIADMMAASAAYIQEARRGTITHEQLLAMARENIAKGRFSIDTLLQRRPGQTFSPEDTLAARLIGVSVAEEFAARVKQFSDNPGPDTEKHLLTFVPLFQEIMAQWSGLAEASGQTLGAFIPDASGQLQYLSDINNRLQSVPTGMTTEEFAMHLGGLRTTEEVLATLKHIPTWGELFLSGLYGVKLMRFSTDFKNIAGSAATFFWNTAVRYRASHFPGYSGEVPIGEAGAMLYGWWKANTMLLKLWGDLSDVRWQDRPTAMMREAASRVGFDTIYEQLKTEGLSGNKTITPENIRARAALSGPTMQAVGNFMVGGPRREGLVYWVGALLNFSGSKLNFEDLVAKFYNYMGEGYAQAIREAMSQETPLQGEELTNWLDNYVMTMQGTVKQKVIDMAFENTLTEKLGPIASHAENFINAAPGLRLIMLFFRTPLNAARLAVRNSPLGRLAQKNQEMLAAGGADADIARARMAMGRDLMGIAVMLGLMGLATARQPGNPESRRLLQEDAKRPDFGLWVPGVNRFISYDWLDPVSMIFGMGAGIAQLIRHGDLKSPDWWESVGMAFAAAGLSLRDNVLSRTYMSEFRNTVDIVMPSEGVDPEAYVGKWRRLLLSQVRGVIPPPLVSLRRTVDPVVRETYGMLDTLIDSVPFWSKSLPASHNKLGYIRLHKDNLGPDYVIPIHAPPQNANPVFQELGRLVEGGYLSIPDTPRRLKLGNDNVDLTPEERSKFELLIAGGNPSVTGRPGKLEQELKKFMQSTAYREKLSDIGRGFEVRKTIMEFQDIARNELIEDFARLRHERETRQRQQIDERYQQRPRIGVTP